MHGFAVVALVLIRLYAGAKAFLEMLNRKHVLAHAGEIPPAYRDTMDAATYAKSVEYTLAQIRLGWFELSISTLVTLVVLFSGILPAAWNLWTAWAGTSVWAAATGLFLVPTLMGLASMPLEWWGQFRLEARFGFNTTTMSTWCMDRVKGLLLGAALMIPLVALLLKLVSWTGDAWWIWGWGVFVAFQLLLMVLAPVIIMPLFNKFTPLPDGSLKSRLLDLARRTEFHARSIEVMDGSRRSRHSNAFFTGLGKFRKIVLFDTLITQLGEEELEAVLAHEIGHFRLRHIPKMFTGSVLMLLAGFAALAWLAKQAWFFEAFGFTPSVPIAFLLFMLLSSAVTFWFTPTTHILSRRFEYQADAFAAKALGKAAPLVNALRKLYEKNLANLTPHPLYSGFYYSHPTLLERETALNKLP